MQMNVRKGMLKEISGIVRILDQEILGGDGLEGELCDVEYDWMKQGKF